MGKKYLITAISVIMLLAAVTGCRGEEIPTTTTNTQATTQIQRTIRPPTITITIPPGIPGATPIPTEMLEQELIEKLMASEEIYNAIGYPNTIENEILSKYLESLGSDGYYTIVYPQTTIDSDMYSDKEYIIESFDEMGYDISKLYDRFMEINKSPSLLTVKSSMAEGYYIDFDWKFIDLEHLFTVSDGTYQKGGGWWAFVYRNFPHFRSELQLSMPACDLETGYVLLYIFVMVWNSPESGYGWSNLHLMKYEGGILTDICTTDIVSSAQLVRKLDY